jgi:hypothetical protein
MAHKITSFVIAETSSSKRGKEMPMVPLTKSAPHYFEKSIPSQFILNQKEIKVDGRPAKIAVKSYHPDAVLVECFVDVDNILAPDVLVLKDKMIDTCHEYAKKNGGHQDIAEEYTLYQIFNEALDPEEFLSANKERVAGLLKSEKMELALGEVGYTISSRFSYGKNDMIVVDWDGALVFDSDGEMGETMELFELANYQLLRYRALDQNLDKRLSQINKLVQRAPGWLPSEKINQEFREIIKTRSQIINQFEALERDIKLIGEWYSARLYEMLSKKFRLDGWRMMIKDKMDSLEDVYTVAAENLGMSKIHRLEMIQIWGFFILQIGWLVLIVLEFAYFTK